VRKLSGGYILRVEGQPVSIRLHTMPARKIRRFGGHEVVQELPCRQIPGR